MLCVISPGVKSKISNIKYDTLRKNNWKPAYLDNITARFMWVSNFCIFALNFANNSAWLVTRAELDKNVKRLSEEAKVSIRNIRQDGMNFIKKFSSQSTPEDEIKIIQGDLQKLTDSYIETISEKSKNKENEILQI